MDEMKNINHSRSWFIVITLLGIATAALMALFAEQVFAPTVEEALSGITIHWWLTIAFTFPLFIILNLVISTASIRRYLANFIIIIMFKAVLSITTALVFLTQWHMGTAIEKATYASPLTAMLQIIAAFLLTLFLNAFYYAEEEMEEQIATRFARPQIRLPEMEETRRESAKEALSLAPISPVEQKEGAEAAAALVAETTPSAEKPITVQSLTEATAIDEAKISVHTESKLPDNALYKESVEKHIAEPEQIVPSAEATIAPAPSYSMSAGEVAQSSLPVYISVNSILKQVPQNERAMDAEEVRIIIGGNGLLSFPMTPIVGQLPEGVVFWDAVDALARLPKGALLSPLEEVAKKIPAGKVELPLFEIIRQIPYEKLAVPGKATEEDDNTYPDLFAESEKEKIEAPEPIEMEHSKLEPAAIPEETKMEETALQPSITESPSRSLDKSDLIKISIGSILSQIPSHDIAKSAEEIKNTFGTDILYFPLSNIIGQLPEGIVIIDAAEVIAKLPTGALKRSPAEVAAGIPNGKIKLPLSEIIPQVPTDMLMPSGEAWHEDEGLAFPDLFTESTPPEETIVTSAPLEPAIEHSIEEKTLQPAQASDETLPPTAPNRATNSIRIGIESIVAQIPSSYLAMSLDEIRLGGLSYIEVPLDKVLPGLAEGQIEWDAKNILEQLPAKALTASAENIASALPDKRFILPLNEIVSQMPLEKYVRLYETAEEETKEMPDLFAERQVVQPEETAVQSQTDESPPLEIEVAELAEASAKTTEAETTKVVSIEATEMITPEIKQTEPETTEMPMNEGITAAADDVPSEEVPLKGDMLVEELSSAPAVVEESIREIGAEPLKEIPLIDASVEISPEIETEPLEEVSATEALTETIQDENTVAPEIAEALKFETVFAITETTPTLPSVEAETISDVATSLEKETAETPDEIQAKNIEEVPVKETEITELEEATAKSTAVFGFTEEREVPFGDVIRGAFGPFSGGRGEPPIKTEKAPVPEPLPETEPFDPSEECVKVSAQYILSQLPPDSLGMTVDQIITKLRTPGKVMVPRRIVVPQLSEGIIEVEFLKLVPQFPSKAFLQPVENIAEKLPHKGKVELSLKEVISQLPLEIFASHESKKPEDDVSPIPEPFEGLLSESFNKPTVPDVSPKGIEGFTLAKDAASFPETFKMDLSSLDFVPQKTAESVVQKLKETEPEQLKKEISPAKEKKATLKPAEEVTLPIVREVAVPSAIAPTSPFEGLDETPKPKQPEKVEFVGFSTEISKPESKPVEESKPERKTEQKIPGSMLTAEDIKEIEALLERARPKEVSKEEGLEGILGKPDSKPTETTEEKAEKELEELVNVPTSGKIEKELEALPPLEAPTETDETSKEKEVIHFNQDGVISNEDIQYYFSRLNLFHGGIYASNGMRLAVLADEDTSCDDVAKTAVPAVSMLADFVSRYGIGAIRKIMAIGKAGTVAAFTAGGKPGRYVVAAEHDSDMAGQMSVYISKNTAMFSTVFDKGAVNAKKISSTKRDSVPFTATESVGAFWEQLMAALSDAGINCCRTLQFAEGKNVVICYPEGFPEALLNAGEPLFTLSFAAEMLESEHFGPFKNAIIVTDKYIITYSIVASNSISGIICVFPATYKEGLAKLKADKAAATITASAHG
jgi:hypothetical protein